MVKVNTHRKISWCKQTVVVATGLSEDEIFWPNGLDALLADENPDAQKPLFLYRTVSNLLIRLSCENLDKSLDKIESLPIETTRQMRAVVDIIIEKAEDIRSKAELYAQVCNFMSKFHVVSHPKNDELYFLEFRSVLYCKCRKQFDNFLTEGKQRLLSSKVNNGKIYRKFIGLSLFISELCKLKMCPYYFMYQFIMKLLSLKKCALTKCIMQLLPVVGKRLVLKLEEDDEKRKLFQLFNNLSRVIRKLQNTLSPELISKVEKLINFRKDYQLLYKRTGDKIVTSKSKIKTSKRSYLKRFVSLPKIQNAEYFHSLKNIYAIKSFNRLRRLFSEHRLASPAADEFSSWITSRNLCFKSKKLPEAISELIRFVILTKNGNPAEDKRCGQFLICSIEDDLFSSEDVIEGFWHFLINAELHNLCIPRKRLESILNPFFESGFFQKSIRNTLAFLTPNNFKASVFDQKMKMALFLRAESLEYVVSCVIDMVMINSHWYQFYATLCGRILRIVPEKKTYSILLMEACDRNFDRYVSTNDKFRMIGFCRFFSLLVNRLNNRTSTEFVQRRMGKLIDAFKIEFFCEVYDHLKWKEALFQESLFDSRIPELLSKHGLEVELQQLLRRVAKNYANRKKNVKKRDSKNIELSSSTTQKLVTVKARIVANEVEPPISGADILKKPKKLSIHELHASVTAILDKSTSEKLDPLVKKMMSLPIDDVPKLQLVVDLIYDKATDNPNFSRTCAKICHMMQRVTVSEAVSNQGQTFRVLLTNRCHHEFECNMVKKLNMMKKLKEIIGRCTKNRKKKKIISPWSFLAVEREAERKLVGSCRFIGELFNIQMLPVKAVLYCITKLLESIDEPLLNCLYNLLTTTAKDLRLKLKPTEKKKVKKMYRDKILYLQKNNEQELSLKIRSTLNNVINYYFT